MKLELPDTIAQATFYPKEDLPVLPDVVYSGVEGYPVSSWSPVFLKLKTT